MLRRNSRTANERFGLRPLGGLDSCCRLLRRWPFRDPSLVIAADDVDTTGNMI